MVASPTGHERRVRVGHLLRLLNGLAALGCELGGGDIDIIELIASEDILLIASEDIIS